MKLSSLAIIFCYVLLLGSMGSVFSKENAAFPSASSPPDIEAMLKDLDGWRETVNQTLSKATIFFPTEVPLELVRGVNSTVIKYHVVPYASSFFQLKHFKNGTRLPTLMHNKSILITSNDGTNFTIDDSHISHPNMFYDGKNAVHGVSTLLNYNICGGNATVSFKPPLKIAQISPTSPPPSSPPSSLPGLPALGQSSHAPPLPPSSLNPLVAPKPPPTTLPKIDAIFKDLDRWRNILDESRRATIFFPNTLSKKFMGEVPSTVIKYHVVPYALSFFDLKHFKNGTRLPTLMHNTSILITSTDDTNFTIDGNHISHPDMFYDGKNVVHGVSTLLNYNIYRGNATVSFKLPLKIAQLSPTFPTPSSPPPSPLPGPPALGQSSHAPPPPPSSLNPPVAPKPPHTTIPKIDAIFKDLDGWRNILDESKRATFFFPNTQSKKFLREVPSSVIKYHVVPYALSFFALKHFKNGTRFPTLMHKKSILITSNDVSDFTIDGRPISDPDMFYDGKHAIHGMPTLLNYHIYGGKANSPKSPPSSSLNPPVAPKLRLTVAPTPAPSPHHVGPPTSPHVAVVPAPSPSSNPTVVHAPTPSADHSDVRRLSITLLAAVCGFFGYNRYAHTKCLFRLVFGLSVLFVYLVAVVSGTHFYHPKVVDFDMVTTQGRIQSAFSG